MVSILVVLVVTHGPLHRDRLRHTLQSEGAKPRAQDRAHNLASREFQHHALSGTFVAQDHHCTQPTSRCTVVAPLSKKHSCGHAARRSSHGLDSALPYVSFYAASLSGAPGRNSVFSASTLKTVAYASHCSGSHTSVSPCRTQTQPRSSRVLCRTLAG